MRVCISRPRIAKLVPTGVLSCDWYGTHRTTTCWNHEEEREERERREEGEREREEGTCVDKLWWNGMAFDSFAMRGRGWREVGSRGGREVGADSKLIHYFPFDQWYWVDFELISSSHLVISPLSAKERLSKLHFHPFLHNDVGLRGFVDVSNWALEPCWQPTGLVWHAPN